MADPWEIVNAIAQTVGALGTTGALLVAAITFKRQVRNAERAQADAISIATHGIRLDSEGSRQIGRTCVVANYSAMPIYGVRLRGNLSSNAGVSLAEMNVLRYQTLKPAEEMVLEVSGAGATPNAQVTFRDTSSRWWLRDTDGRIERIEDRSLIDDLEGRQLRQE